MIEIIISIISGMITGLGMGGGSILIVLLTVFKGIDQKVAQGINLLFFISTSIIASIINGKQCLIKKNVLFPIMVVGIIGTIVGAILSSIIDTKILKKCFAGFIFLIAVYEVLTMIKDNKMNKKNQNKT